MANAKFVKTAAAVALGASVVTTAVAPGAASAATSYKIKDGKLYKNGKIAKGYVVYKGTLYKNGKKNKGYAKVGTGSSMKLYYNTKLKKGFKTANNATLLFKDGVLYKGYKQAGSNERLYKDGKLTTGWIVYTNDEGTKYLYSKGYLYTGLKTATRSGVKNLFENGVLAEGEKAYKDELYVDGVLAEGVKEFDGVTYIDGKKDVAKPEITAEDQTIEYGAKDVDVLSFAKVEDNSKEEIKAEAKISFDGKDVEKIDTKKPGVYTVTYTAKDKNGNEAEAKEIKVTVAEAKEAKVESVEAINATQVEIKFSKALNKDTVELSDVTLKALDTALNEVTKVELSKDGKTVLVTTKNALEGRYDVTVAGLKDVDGKDAVKYEGKNLDFGKDTKAPTITGTEKVNSATTKVVFSEPLSSEGSWTFKDATGKTVTATATLSTTESNVVVVTINDETVKPGTEVTATVLGAKDKANNTVNPNPSTVKLVKGDKDGIAPTVASVKAVDLATIEITLSEKVQQLAAANVTVDGTDVKSITQDADDATKFVVKTAAPLKAGLHKVEVKSTDANPVLDLTGEKLTDFSQLVDFQADTTQPAFLSSAVVVNADTKKEQLVLSFDKEVKEADLTAVAYTAVDKDLVTTTGTSAIKLTVNPENKKQLIVNLADIAGLTKGSTYTYNFAKGAISDTALDPNTTDAFQVKFTRGEDGLAQSTDKPVVSKVEATDSNTIEVTFDKAVDGVTATNAANYTIPGLTIEKATLLAVEGTTQKVKLTLAKNTNELNGPRDITIANVKAKNGEVMETVTKTIDLVENVAPTVTKAQFTNTNADGKVIDITVTFSENVTVAADAFEVYVGTSSTPVESTTVAVETASAANTATIKLTAGLSTEDIAKGITVKQADGKVIADIKGNALDFSSIAATK